MSPTSGLVADVAMVDALLVVVPWDIRPAFAGVVLARGAVEQGGSRVRGHSQASVAARHRGVVC